MAVTIQLRRDTLTNWTTNNPTPKNWEPCYETDTWMIKYWNWVDDYNTLPYFSTWWGWDSSEVSFELWEDLTAWDLVQIINDSGAKVKKIASVATEVVWAASIFDTSLTRDQKAVQLDTNKILVTYMDEGDSYQRKAVVWEVSGTDITFWSPVIFSDNTNSTVWYYDVEVIDVDKAIFTYYDPTLDFVQAVVWTVSGSVITLGTVENIVSSTAYRMQRIQKLDTNTWVILHMANNGSDQYVVSFTVTWSSITIWTPLFIANWGDDVYVELARVTSSRVMLSFSAGTTYSQLRMIDVAWDTCTLVWSSFVSLTRNQTGVPEKIMFHEVSSTKLVICKMYTNTNKLLEFAVIDITGDDMWFTNSIVMTVSATVPLLISWHSWTSEFIISRSWGGYKYKPVTVNWTTLTLWSQVIVDSNANYQNFSLWLWSGSRYTALFLDTQSKARIFWPASSLIEPHKFAWVIQETWVSWESKIVTLNWWVATVSTTLVPWEKYYIDEVIWDLTSTESNYYVWRAISTTQLNLN